MSINRDSVDCRLVDPVGPTYPAPWFPSASEALLKGPGDFFWTRDAQGRAVEIVIWIPGNESGTVAPIPVVNGAPQNEGPWGWNGNEQKPTLQPSIFRNPPHKDHPDPRNSWHGHLIDGRLVSC